MVDAEIELLDVETVDWTGDRFDIGWRIKKEGGINVRFLVWVNDWIMRLFTEERKNGDK